MKEPEGKSYGVYDAYKAIRKEKWAGIGKPLSEHIFYTIIREMNNLMAEELSKGNSITLPCKMGRLELRKSKRGVSIHDGRLHVTYPVDWKSTLNLWQEDAEAKKNKTLIRFENEYIYSIRYCKNTAMFNNKVFFSFHLNRKIKRKLKENINNGEIDTLWLKNYNTQA